MPFQFKRKRIDCVVFQCREWEYRPFRRTHELYEILVFRAVERTDRLDMLDALGDLLADVLDERAASVDAGRSGDGQRRDL